VHGLGKTTDAQHQMNKHEQTKTMQMQKVLQRIVLHNLGASWRIELELYCKLP